MMAPPPPPPPPHIENGHYSPGPKPQPPFMLCLNIINTVTQLLLGAVACGAFSYANNFTMGSSLTQHIYLCVTGYVILMSQAILTISPASWASSVDHETKKTIHLTMQILGSILAITGSVVRIVNLDDHFSSAHAIFGILALVFTCLSLFGGIINLFSTRGPPKFNAKFINICHSCLGCITISLAFLALVLGFEKFAFGGSLSTTANMLMAFTVLALIGTLTPASVTIVSRLKK